MARLSILLPMGLLLGACTTWPDPGRGGLAELRPAPERPRAQMTDQEWQRQARLDCTLARFETVAAAAGRAGLFSGRVALARHTAARARREHEGGLPADAAQTLERLETETGALRLALPAGTLEPGELPECR